MEFAHTKTHMPTNTFVQLNLMRRFLFYFSYLNIKSEIFINDKQVCLCVLRVSFVLGIFQYLLLYIQCRRILLLFSFLLPALSIFSFFIHQIGDENKMRIHWIFHTRSQSILVLFPKSKQNEENLFENDHKINESEEQQAKATAKSIYLRLFQAKRKIRKVSIKRDIYECSCSDRSICFFFHLLHSTTTTSIYLMQWFVWF